jgi:hypothetical protein
VVCWYIRSSNTTAVQGHRANYKPIIIGPLEHCCSSKEGQSPPEELIPRDFRFTYRWDSRNEAYAAETPRSCDRCAQNKCM